MEKKSQIIDSIGRNLTNVKCSPLALLFLPHPLSKRWTQHAGCKFLHEVYIDSGPNPSAVLSYIETRIYQLTTATYLHSPLPQLQLRIHPNNAPNQVPITVISNPIADHNPRTPVSHVLAIHWPFRPRNASTKIVFGAKELYDRRVQFRRNLLGPTPHFPEITGTQEIDIERLLGRRIRAHGSYARQNAHALCRSLQMVLRVLQFFVDILRLEHLVEILNANVAARACTIRGIVRPRFGIDAPTRAVPFVLQAVVEREAPHQHDLVSGFAEGGDPRGGKPATDVPGVVVAQYAT